MTFTLSRPGARLAGALALFGLLPAAVHAQTARPAAATAARRVVPPAPTGPVTFDSTAFSALRWREIGPARGGRSVAVAGSVQRPNEYWMGTTGGGVFKTIDGGQNWAPATDSYFGGTIGAIAVDPQNPDVVWVGGGETDIRGNTVARRRPLEDHRRRQDLDAASASATSTSPPSASIRPTRTSPGSACSATRSRRGTERGVFKTTDGGKTCSKVLFRQRLDRRDRHPASIRSNPDMLYAAIWQAYRTPWAMSSGGMGSGIFKTTDGGATWTNLTRTARGCRTGVMGKIGIAVSPAKPSRIWARHRARFGRRVSLRRCRRDVELHQSRTQAAPARLVLLARSTPTRRTPTSSTRSTSASTAHATAARRSASRSTCRTATTTTSGSRRTIRKRMIEANDGGANVSTNGGKNVDRPGLRRRRSCTTSTPPTTSRTRSAARSRTTRRCAGRVAAAGGIAHRRLEGRRRRRVGLRHAAPDQAGHHLRRQLRRPADAQGHAHRLRRATSPSGRSTRWAIRRRTSSTASSGPSRSCSRATTRTWCTRPARSSSGPPTKGESWTDGVAGTLAQRSEDDGRLGRPDHEGPDGRRDVRADLRVRRVAGAGRRCSGSAPTTAWCGSRATTARTGRT